jgi:non-homologous end joining protein Ku
MRQTGVVGIGKVIIRRTQHLAGVRVVGEALVASS